MALDLDAIRKKLNNISGNSKKNNFWRPAEGVEYNVRLLSFKDNDGQPFKERWFYYNIGANAGLLAPYQFGKPDPFQELISSLREAGSKGDKQAYETAKKLYPKMRCFAPVIIRGEEGEGVRLWSFGKEVYTTLLGIMLDEDYGDITDPKAGFDVKVSVSKASGKTWASTDVRARPKTSALSSDPAQAKAWLDSIPNIDDLYELKSYDQLTKLLNDWLENPDDEGSARGGDAAVTAESAESSAENAKASPATSAAIASKLESLNSAFADLED
jgi:hypothetical protein